jgi:DUF4097 and DUF4098 domain-containing protein YvlB
LIRRAWLVVALAALAACDLQEAEQSSVSDLRLEAASGSRPSISIRLERGSVEIVASETETDRVQVVVAKRARSIDPDAAHALLERIDVQSEQSGDRIRIVDRSRLPSGRVLGAEIRADLRLRVPPDTDLDVRTGAGRIQIEGVRGRIVAETADGRVLLEGTRGSATLRSSDGSLVAHNVKGDVDAQTGDGSIQVSGALTRLRAVTSDGRIQVDCDEATAPSGEWVLHTADGSIAISLPPTVAANLDATTSSGRIDNQLSAFRGWERNRRLTGQVGAGGALILLSTMDGRIELRDLSP